MSAVEEQALALFVAHLDGVVQVRNGYLARCPAHEDRLPSLSISQAGDGRLLIHCFAGCDTAAVLAALGRGFADLFDDEVDAGRRKDRARSEAAPFRRTQKVGRFTRRSGVKL